MPASVGFIVLFGVAVLNGLVLVSYIAQLRAQGAGIHEAVAAGCEARLRPVLMTAAIAVFSLIPMIFATGPGCRSPAAARRRGGRRAAHLDVLDPAGPAGVVRMVRGSRRCKGMTHGGYTVSGPFPEDAGNSPSNQRAKRASRQSSDSVVVGTNAGASARYA